jgi:hypothetical protein
MDAAPQVSLSCRRPGQRERQETNTRASPLWLHRADLPVHHPDRASCAQVWAKDRSIVAVRPHADLARYFIAVSEARHKRPKANPDSGVTMTGATGLEPATSAVTGQRSNQLSYAPSLHGEMAPAPRARASQYAKG